MRGRGSRPPGTETTKEELTAYLADRLAYFKVPTRWNLTRNLLPRNTTGKIVRRRPSEDDQPGR